MDKLAKFELMEKIVRQLEDLGRSQQAVLEKVGKIEVDNIELGDKNLEKILPDIYQRTADNHTAITELIDSFADKTTNFGEKNNVDRLREQKEIQNVQ
ncbi:hypothetical protein [Olivibacter sitiensis]|uniref:hypothetical protein n=1 Tax=Olivibacter sitiensis TaxID=376470 RepID=UPI00047FDBF7|nr:hypothetical protein [Olivibacter sitiensis]